MINFKAAALFVFLLAGLTVLLPQATHKGAAGGSRDQESVMAVGKLEDQMRLAALKGDASWWVENLSDGYVETDFQGNVTNKAETIELQRSSALIYDVMNLSERNVHTFNGDTIIITGKLTAEGTFHQKSFSGDFQITRVWVKQGLEWKLASSQTTRIAS
jgi:Domain of unknown function (DUF4440)